jgi:hypothetical protein
MKEKRCTGKCKQVKPLDDFSNKKANRDGKNSKCRDCVRKSRPSRVGQPVYTITPLERVSKRITNKCMERWWE